MARRPEEIKSKEGQELLKYIKTQLKGHSGDKADKMASIIRDRIARGDLPEGISFPVGVYSRQLGASRNTVSAAFKELENDGFFRGGRSTPYILKNQKPNLPSNRGIPFDLRQWAGENNLQLRIESSRVLEEGVGSKKTIRLQRMIGIRSARGSKFIPAIYEHVSFLEKMIPGISDVFNAKNEVSLSIPDVIENVCGEYPVFSEFQIASVEKSKATAQLKSHSNALLEISFTYHLDRGMIGSAQYFADPKLIQIRSAGAEMVFREE